jgi:carboxyl-terminal processing protease
MKNALFVLVLAMALLFCQRAGAQLPDSVRTYVDSTLYLMQSKALSANQLNWPEIRETVYEMAAGATTYKEAFPALVYAFQQLKDYHGVLAVGDTFYRYPPPINFDEVLSPGIKKEFLKGNRIVTAYLNSSVAYLRVPAMQVTRQEDMDAQANMLRDSLCMLLARNPSGIILDLRMNVGGNSIPMQSGIGPLFRQSLLGYSVDREGQFTDEIRLQDGISVNGQGAKMVTIQNTCTASPEIPIAVLIGPSTLSSGEILAALLKQQPNVKLFGEPTPGYCNATEGFVFMQNQAYLLLTVSLIADASKQVYQEMLVHPHVLVKSEDNYDKPVADPTVKMALNWLQPGKKSKLSDRQ